ncbi:MAG: hypothetical protein Crog4KO_26640 [Crocinitomicaceae bacterium]
MCVNLTDFCSIKHNIKRVMKKNLFLILVASLLTHYVSGQIIRPYLQAKTPTSIYINWISASAGTPTVSYGTNGNNLTASVTGSQSQFFDGGDTYFYSTVQPINLAPNTRYYYQVNYNGQQSDTLSFKTSPLPGQAASQDGHLRFLIMGDNQIQQTGRYDTLVAQARRKVVEKYGDPSEFIELSFMVGDQVDLGNLDQYENIHFAYNYELSGEVPIQTTVGNHETYGSLGLSAYYSHFYLDQISYQGINSGTENYYAYQVGNVLFISLSSEHTGTAQFNWLQQVMTASANDTTVDWVFTFSHRPYEAEQYVGDISTWVKNTAVPFCMQNEKYLMHVGAHHHIYSRGQFKDAPVYNIISGGTAWDQYWGQSNEADFDYIQKTISNWCYQIVDVDVINDRVDVECYSIGSPIMFSNGEWKQNELVDEFHRQKNQVAPDQPIISTNFGDSLELPFLITTTPYSASSSELLNTTEFQFSQANNFSVVELDILRDFENLFGQAPGQAADSTQDLNAGVNIESYEVPVGMLPNGWHYLRVRHRDRNLEWSAWSPVDSFLVYNSFVSGPAIVMDSNEYQLGSPMLATYLNGPGNATDWVGLYQLDDVPGTTASADWAYCSGTSGTLNFPSTALTQSDMYYAAFFELDGYGEIAQRDTFYYGNVPVITSDTTAYPIGTIVPIYLANAPAQVDSIEIIKVGYQHGVQTPEYWGAVTGPTQQIDLNGLPEGYFVAQYYFNGEYAIGEPFYFSVGDTITNLWIDQPVYDLGDDIIATWTDAPGIVKDWLGIYNDGDDPNVDPLQIYSYFDGIAHGSKTLSDTLVPQIPGDYFIVMFTNDSYTEVSNREYFTVIDPSTGIDELDKGISIYPNPSKNNNMTVLSSEYPIEWIQLRNTEGKVVYRTENVNGLQYSLLTQQLAAGTYILEIQTRKQYRYKVIVQ